MSTSTIQTNLNKVLSHLASLSTTVAELVAVSKLKPASDILQAYNCNHRHFGENYVSELVEKSLKLPVDIKWHMIGHLQSNKVNKLISACANLYMIETVDSEKLASKIESAMKLSRPSDRLKVLVEVITSSEDTKSGIPASNVRGLIAHIQSNCPHLEFAGLMTIAHPETPEASFRQLAELKRALQLENIPVQTLSMGMSGDYELAVQHGSDQVRIGSSIFGSR